MFLAVILVPEMFRKLRETPGINFHLVSYHKTNENEPLNGRKEFISIFVLKPRKPRKTKENLENQGNRWKTKENLRQGPS